MSNSYRKPSVRTFIAMLGSLLKQGGEENDRTGSVIYIGK